MAKGAWGTWMAVALLAMFICAAAGEMGRVLMRDVTAVTFTKGKLTTGRRSSPVPQQVCMGSACATHQPEVVQCKQVGWDGDAQWECTAHLEGGLRFGAVEVTCEGFDFADDPYILRGSCGLEYSLVGQADDSSSSYSAGYGAYDDAYYGKSSRGSWGSSIFTFVVLAFIAFALYSVLFNPQPAGGAGAAAGGRGYGGGGYPGGGGGGGYPGGGYTPGYGGACSPGYAAPAAAAAGGGFWNGMLTGGLLGYMVGGRNRGYGGYGYGARPMGTYGGFGGGGMRMGGGGGMRMGGGGGGGSRSGFGGTRRR